MSRALAAALVIVVTVLAAGCGSDEDGEADETAAPATSAAVEPATGEPLPPSTSAPELSEGQTVTELTEPGGASITVPPADTGVGATELEITVWELGRDEGKPKPYTLSCDPVGGTLPEPERACTTLAAGAIDFAPVPADAVCTMIYGGPAVATVTGTVFGDPVDAEFSRENGCQAERWDSASALLPADLASWAGDEGLLGSTQG